MSKYEKILNEILNKYDIFMDLDESCIAENQINILNEKLDLNYKYIVVCDQYTGSTINEFKDNIIEKIMLKDSAIDYKYISEVLIKNANNNKHKLLLYSYYITKDSEEKIRSLCDLDIINILDIFPEVLKSKAWGNTSYIFRKIEFLKSHLKTQDFNQYIEAEKAKIDDDLTTIIWGGGYHTGTMSIKNTN